MLWEYASPIYIHWVDLQKAYDCEHLLWEVLQVYGVVGLLFCVIRSLFVSTPFLFVVFMDRIKMQPKLKRCTLYGGRGITLLFAGDVLALTSNTHSNISLLCVKQLG